MPGTKEGIRALFAPEKDAASRDIALDLDTIRTHEHGAERGHTNVPDDAELLKLARAAKNGAKFAGLYDGDTTGYPSASEADSALCARLGYWTNCDVEQTDRLFRASALMRDKWDTRRGANTYGEQTIHAAFDKAVTETYGGPGLQVTRVRTGTDKFVYMIDVEAEQVEWLWYGYIPLGKITMLEGDPGLGKSMLTLNLAGIVTGRHKGLPDGGHTDVDGGVVLVSLEDGLGDTIRPRLDAVTGADLRRIIALNMVPDGDGVPRLITIPGDLDIIERAIVACGAKLLILDPLSAILDSKHNINSDQDVRRALAPLAELADRHGCAVVVLRHLGKDRGRSALYRGAGSIGVIGAARAGLMVAKSPDDPEHERIFSQTKSNLGRPMPSRTYRIEEADNGVGYVVWGSESLYSADQLANQDPEVSGALGEAVQFLTELLKDGPVFATEGEAARKAAGITERALDRARKRLKVESVREGGIGDGGRWKWERRPLLRVLPTL